MVSTTTFEAALYANYFRIRWKQKQQIVVVVVVVASGSFYSPNACSKTVVIKRTYNFN